MTQLTNRQPFFILLLTVVFLSLYAFQAPAPGPESPDNAGEKAWVDSIYNAMSEDERIGQLFMIRAHSDLGPDHVAKVEQLVKDYHVGSMCFFQGSPEEQIRLINKYQEQSRIPMLMAIDAEWGLGMRMKTSTISFPYQLTLGAIQNNQLLYDMGVEVGKQLLRTGLHINFAPVVDVNNNAANPVINFRSFGEDRYNVTAKSYQYMRGMQEAGLLTSAKHFPGHGDTDVDSHLDLPVITHDRARLDSIELYPFKALIKRGLTGMMIAHLSVPAFDSRKNRPTTLSRATVTRLLRDSLGFDGLIYTDALEMKGVTKHFAPGETEAEAVMAGADVLCLPEDLGAALREIKRYLADGKIDPSQVEASVKRILRAKYRLGLTRFTPIPQQNVREELNNREALALKQTLLENAMTLVRNPGDLIPFNDLDTTTYASLSIGSGVRTPFQNRLADYVEMPHLQVGKEISGGKADELVSSLSKKDVVIIGLHNMSSRASQNYGITQSTINFVRRLAGQTKVVLVVFGNPYSLKYFDELDWVLEAYQEDGTSQDVAAQALFGAFPIRGRLPVTASDKSRFNTGVSTRASIRLGYALPEAVGMDSDTLSQIGDLIRNAIDTGATPGAVVLIAKDGRVVFHEAYGHHTYSKSQVMERDDIFDLASVTKIAATTMSIMRLQGEGKLDIDHPLSQYFGDLANSNKKDLVPREIMAHRAGLHPWIPFFEQTLSGTKKNPKPSSKYYRSAASGDYTIPVTEKLFMRQDFADSIWQQIIHSELRANKNYVYSDLGFYMLGRTVGQVSGTPIEQYVEQNFYHPLGLQTATYNPWMKYDPTTIVPSERDQYWRQQKVQAYVHDMGAAMLGGVSGHAGLFADANDLAILLEMVRRGGHYGGRRYLKKEVINDFTHRFTGDSRRGIGFDMLELNNDKPANLSRLASTRTFGHLGFTGTAVWVDPDQDLIFIFLSNRTYPSMYNRKLGSANFRPRVQDVVYKAIR
ncbi:glycoside hydrolase family 3 N-terminal domain-containing protein [Flavilitoribacter nigricans]|uniref:beta-N-acetylhexosaminidase n=1 Tax=Flavilitoribacter nigricans (strain ATCC 23147 / DSM 23189 / NBRC 102662 / NCIMB 1420 / SS-2) TaxID=1122177 RepID=A0A2D0MYE7_FLAN2|nr:glycoside hydrolase family 3 N-terminal domain-containing protein [Flavilitoribacter nigricans]PHN01312.1 beta-N-acetylhexosaminidase [Flavilitoribacter nigricans DSM 23189 = NBRC 102662]